MLVVAAATNPRAGSSRRHRRRAATALVAFVAAVGLVLTTGGAADAAIVPTVPLGTSAPYAVLGGSTVTNTGPSILDGSLGVSPGSALTGFPPGIVLPPGTQDAANAVAAQAQSDLTAAYNNAAGRSLNATTTANLGGLTLQGGVYAGASKGALGLTGTLVLDGAGNANSVFIFQTNSSLITASGSTVSLIGGAQACNVFWQVGSSATLGTNSVFVGNILALTSITVTTGVTVAGRALARNGAVTLDTDVFTEPSCATGPPVTTTPTTTATSADTTAPGGPTTAAATIPTRPPADTAITPTVPAAGSPGGPVPTPESPGTPPDSTSRTVTRGDTPRPAPPSLTPTPPGAGGPGVPVAGPPRTGTAPVPATGPSWPMVLLLGLAAGGATAGALLLGSRHRALIPER